MSRHLADHRSRTDGGRLKHFYRIEKEISDERAGKVARSLHQRPLSREGVGRTGNYFRIERGISA